MVKLHQLRVLTLGLSRTVILRVLNIHLKIAFYTEDLRYQDHQGLLKELSALIASPTIALILGLGHHFGLAGGRQNSQGHGSALLGLTSAMATCFLSTLDGPARSDGAKDHDLPNFSTMVHLAEESAAKKSTTKNRVVTEGSLAVRGTTQGSLWDPSAVGDPLPRQRPSSLQTADAGHAPRQLYLSRIGPWPSKGWERTLQPGYTRPRPSGRLRGSK
ncbi:hypothetical protein Cgig2_018918 [Carnegiea gigantea]|uniref:Uncharacterized protein n=1 Tax=Carnegiea gigantea TaxID=171969 RepID=A0A9Q1GRR1_9CARY|nr:hypothetical protein Cgig2_018918 [Carnegiea gigantea]